jgi:aryl-alcohol dehydrogenase-like predicted oxidoreductase
VTAAADSFTRVHVPALGRSVFRLGLACNYGIDARGFEAALERGVDYVFWTSRRTGHLRESLRQALRRRRESLTVASGPSIAYFGGNVRRGAERLLRELGTDYIDALHLFWLGTTSALTEGTVEVLQKLKAEGKIRAIAVSIHDRPRAGQLVAGSPIDLFMLRYNAAHPGAERDVFPHFPPPPKPRPAIVAYTATSWRKLLSSPRRWTGPVMTAGDCYRFCLSSPHVDVTLTGPKTQQQLEESLSALERGPLSADEDRWMRAFGRAVHGGAAPVEAPVVP